MALTHTVDSLGAALDINLRTALDLEIEEEPLPWYVRGIAGIAGWIAALFFLSFVGLCNPFPIAAYLLVGPPLILLSAALRRASLGALADFKNQIALVGALTARLLIAAALFALMPNPWIVALIMVATEAVIGLVFPDALQRVLATLSGWGWILFAGNIEAALDSWWIATVSLAATAIALGLWAARGHLEQLAITTDQTLRGLHRWGDPRLFSGAATAVAIGTTMVSLGLQLRFFVIRTPAAAWTGVGFAILAGMVVAWLLVRHRVGIVPSVAALIGTAILSAMALQVPGVILALSFTLLGIRTRERVLLGLSGTFLAVYASGFYYVLDVPFVVKGLAMIGSGTALLVGRLLTRTPTEEVPAGISWGPRLVTIGGLALATAVMTTQVARQEYLLATGEAVYLQLVPRDPRSLVQGDFMRLEYAVARRIRTEVRKGSPRRSGFFAGPTPHQRGQAVLRIDEDDVAHFVRMDTGGTLAGDEIRVDYHSRSGHVEVASRAFLFQEGLGTTYDEARYGRVVIGRGGRTLLVSLADEDREPLGDPPKRW